jgi:UDP-glucose 4-epimerase
MVKRLVDAGLSISVLDNNSRGNLEKLDGYLSQIDFIEGDVTSLDCLVEACNNIDTVFHLAAINGTENFYRIPGLVLGVGVKGALNSLDAAVECEVTNYIVTSSSEVYQEPTHLPTTEEERIIIPDMHNPRFSYSAGKIINEALAIHYAPEALRTIICRPHNFYGPDMGIAHVIPQLILRMKELSNDFKIKSIDFPIQGTGNETRSFCFIDDGINSLLVAAVNGNSKEIYHLGTEDEISISDLVFEIGKLLDLEINIIPNESLKGGTQRRCPSIKKICNIGFIPKVPLVSGLKATIDYYLNYQHIQTETEIVA